MLSMNARGKITSQTTTLRERLAQLDPAFYAQEQQRNAMLAMQAQAQLTALQKAAALERKIVLERAKAALGKGDVVGRQKAKLGNAIKSYAMRDMNCLRGKCTAVPKLERVCAVVAEYGNLGRVWG